ncbi:PP2C family protein-serine/threonine phosphatase [Streptomyces polygonati]
MTGASGATGATGATGTAGSAGPTGPPPGVLPPRGTPDHGLAVQDRLAASVCDLSLLHELTEHLARTRGLDDTLREVLRAGAALVGAGRGLIALEPSDGLGPDITVGLGLGHGDLGTLETVPPVGLTEAAHRSSGPPRTDQARADRTGTGETPSPEPRPPETPSVEASVEAALDAALDATTPEAAFEAVAPDTPPTGLRHARDLPDPVETLLPDLRHDPSLAPRHREVAAQLGLGASYALGLAAAGGRLGTAVWFYDEPAEPTDRQRRLTGLYLRFATEHIARCLDLSRARGAAASLAAELLPARLPRAPGVRMAVRHHTGPRGGGDWYDALPLPEGGLGLAVGGVTGAGPGAVAAMGRLRASLRAYAVMEGEDPVAVLSDLELLMRLTEPARSATALFAYATAAAGGGHKLILAGAGHCPPLLVGDHRCEYVETSLSAPLNMLSCWEAPSVEVRARPGESLLLYTDGLLHRTGESADRAVARLHSAAQSASRTVREDPELLADHILRTLLPDGLDRAGGVEDLVLLVTRFE